MADHKSEYSFRCFGVNDQGFELDRAGWQEIRTSAQTFPHSGPRFLSYSRGLRRSVLDQPLDVLHQHGLWQSPSLVATEWRRRFRKPSIVSPHGMLDRWALEHSAWKKRIAGALYERTNLKNANVVHALCDAEMNSIREYGINKPIAVIPNGVEIPNLSRDHRTPDFMESIPEGSKVLLYLGRIHPKKGIELAIRALGELSKFGQNPMRDWVLLIAGWNQNDHQSELQQIASECGVAGQCRFIGPQFDAAKTACYRFSDAFILPSYSEGLPMVVLEAWSHGLPVMMTDACNLKCGFDESAAVRVDTNVASIVKGLTQIGAMSANDRKQMGANGRNLVSKSFTWEKVAKDMISVYQWCWGEAEKPDCVVL